MDKLLLTVGLFVLSVVSACGGTAADTTSAPTTKAGARTAAEFNDVRCGRWEEQGLSLEELRQMVSDSAGFDWDIVRDTNSDGYPCETELGTGYLPEDGSSTETPETVKGAVLTETTTTTTTTTRLPASTTSSALPPATTTIPVDWGPANLRDYHSVPNGCATEWQRVVQSSDSETADAQVDYQNCRQDALNGQAWASVTCRADTDTGGGTEHTRGVQRMLGVAADGIWGDISETAWEERCGRQYSTTTTTTTAEGNADAPGNNIGASTAYLDSLNELTVTPERNSGYDRDDWSVRWPSRVDNYLRWQDPDCRLAFYGASDNTAQCNVNNRDPHREHLVAVKEAHGSGGYAWPNSRKKDFYTYLPNLYVMNARENSQKSDRDPGGWVPTRNRCRYAREWIDVKTEWGLSVDQPEKQALVRMLNECSPSETNAADNPAPEPTSPPPTTTTAPPPPPPPAPAPPAGPTADQMRNTRNCKAWESLGSAQQLQEAVIAAGRDYDWGRKDGNSDGYPCESQLSRDYADW